jgi:hypothetical protein
MNYKLLSFKSGKSIVFIESIHRTAIKEATSLGLQEDEVFVESIVTSLLEIDEETYQETIKQLNKQFLQSTFKSFDEFLESLLTEDGLAGGTGITSTSFSIGSRPEKLTTPEEDEKDKIKA